jgi:hypothetical protein
MAPPRNAVTVSLSHTVGRKIFFKSLTVDGSTEKRGNRIAKVVFRGLDRLWRRDVYSRCDQGAADILIDRGHGTCCGKEEGTR